MRVDGRGQSSRFWGRPAAGKPAVGNGDLLLLIQDPCQSATINLSSKTNSLMETMKTELASSPTGLAQNFGSTVHLLCSAHMSRVPPGIHASALARLARDGRPLPQPSVIIPMIVIMRVRCVASDQARACTGLTRLSRHFHNRPPSAPAVTQAWSQGDRARNKSAQAGERACRHRGVPCSASNSASCCFSSRRLRS